MVRRGFTGALEPRRLGPPPPLAPVEPPMVSVVSDPATGPAFGPASDPSSVAASSTNRREATSCCRCRSASCPTATPAPPLPPCEALGDDPCRPTQREGEGGEGLGMVAWEIVFRGWDHRALCSLDNSGQSILTQQSNEGIE